MGKNRKGTSKNKELGRILIKDKKISGRQRYVGVDSWRHTSDIQDGQDWNRINLQSVTEKDTLDEFLDTAEMAGIEFTAEKLNITIVGSAGSVSTGVLGEADKKRVKNLQDEHKKCIKVPRRPMWDEATSPEQLDVKEKEAFLNWRRSLALLQEKEQLMLTPYEKNLDIWRQLWRVIERCDVICQIVDGRNPLLYKCDDLEIYVKETNPNKEYIILVNKADYLSEKQRTSWAEYFTELKLKVVFWSALDELSDELSYDDCSRLSKTEKRKDILTTNESSSEDEDENNDDESDDDEISDEDKLPRTDDTDNVDETISQSKKVNDLHHVNSTKLLSQSELIQYFKTFKKVNNESAYGTIGLVGYPNVGKSSTINALLQGKKTAVSSTPGKTKHFQTHFIDEELCLCDCPGLVFPSFVFTTADLVLNGILPVDQLRDHVGPLTLLVQQIPKKVIESTYGINIATPSEIDSSRLPTAEEVLSSYAKMRGFMTSNGLPDCPRASRYIIKDYLKGKLLYCHPPPGVFGTNFEQSQVSGKVLDRLKAKEEKEKECHRNTPNIERSSFDEEFFSDKSQQAHYKVPVQGIQSNENVDLIHKPWKKHNNRNKKEKLRRVYDEK